MISSGLYTPSTQFENSLLANGNIMSKIITYSLRASQENSDEYFEVISDLCDVVTTYIREQLDEDLTNYEIWLDTISPTRGFSREESIYTILNLGILWELYSTPALESKQIVRRILSWLVANRKKNETLKPVIDLLRGVLTGFIPYSNQKKKDPAKVTLQNLSILLDWLKASGEYSEEVARIIDEEVKRLLDEAYKDSLSTLREKKEYVEKLVEMLLDKEVVTGKEFEEIFKEEE